LQAFVTHIFGIFSAIRVLIAGEFHLCRDEAPPVFLLRFPRFFRWQTTVFILFFFFALFVSFLACGKYFSVPGVVVALRPTM